MAIVGKPCVDVVVAGHRDLFGTPKALHEAGLLRTLVTDLYVGKGSWLSPVLPLLPYGPKLLRKVMARNSGLPSQKIIANNLRGYRLGVVFEKRLAPRKRLPFSAVVKATS